MHDSLPPALPPGPHPLDPHHDGSPMYVDDVRPSLGGEVTLRVRVPHAADGSVGAREVVLRAVRDGDHYVVTGRVTTLGDQRDGRPLLFYRGAYTATEAAEPTPGILDNLITWSRHDDWI